MGITNVNDAIPITKWIEYCRAVKDATMTAVRSIEHPNFSVYNNFITNLRRIERRGLRSIKTEKTHYDPYTITGRPSNHFDGINYAALSSEQREQYSSVNGFLIDVDFSGFHLFLLYGILGLEFPKDIYKSLSALYPADVNPKDYTFKQIYGGIDRSLINFTPFKQIDELSDQLFDRYTRGTLTTLLYDRPVYYKSGMTEAKLLSYMLQSLETEFNMELIDKFGDELILYTYDSFLFDIRKNEVVDIVAKIKNVFDGIPYKVKIGENLSNMKLTTI